MDDFTDIASERLFDRVVALAARGGRFGTARRVAELAAFALGDRIVAGNAAQAPYFHARRLGYDIPPYPLAGCGEIKAYFAACGVRNLPEWFAAAGVNEHAYARIHEHTAVLARNLRGEHALALLDGIYHANDKGFLDLAESGVAARLPERKLAALLNDALAFLESPVPLESGTMFHPLTCSD